METPAIPVPETTPAAMPPVEASAAPEAKRRLLVASPAKGGLPLTYIKLFENLLRGGLPDWTVDYLVEGAQSALTFSRDLLADDAVKHNFDAILMLDTDHPATMEHIGRIMSHDLEEFPVVSGLYCMKRPGKPFFPFIRAKGAQPLPSGLLAADFLATGFLRASVAALRQMQAFHADQEVYVQDHSLLPPGPRETKVTMWDLFPIGVNGDRTPQSRLRRIRKAMATVTARGVASVTRPQMVEALQAVVEVLNHKGSPGYLTGEDYGFSLLARQAGVKCWLDLKCMVPHTGSISYPITDPAVLATECDQIPEAEGDQSLW